jgi:hypothetical protein
MKIRLFTVALLLLLAHDSLKVNAQQVLSNDLVKILSTDVRKNDSILIVTMGLDLSNLNIKSNSSATLLPEIKYQGHTEILPEIIINGRTKHIIYMREPNRNIDQNIFSEVLRRNNTKQLIKYKINVPFQKWMKKANLFLNISFCDCSGDAGKNCQLEVLDLSILKLKDSDANSWTPEVSYITSHAGEEKARMLEGKAYLDFHVNGVEILPNYRRNAVELSKIIKTIDEIRNDSNTHIIAIKIHGYASPEGSYVNNKRLAKERAEALKDYVCDLYKFDNKLFTVDYTPEDWDGLSQQIDSTSLIKEKNKIIDIIASDLLPDAKEQKLKEINSGKTYQQLLMNFFPSLRHSEYFVKYNIRNFSINETKDILNKHPQQLSLQEMFLLARTYEKGSKEFNEIMNIAVVMFPEDQIANLNASSIALSKKDIIAAKKYLEKTDKNMPEAINNLGVIAFFDGKNTEALELFSKAAKSGVVQASNNLIELKKEIENN